MKPNRLFTGTILSIVGIVLIVISFFVKIFYVLLIYGIPLFIIGVVILFNKKEDEIEQIKTRKVIRKHKGGKK